MTPGVRWRAPWWAAFAVFAAVATTVPARAEAQYLDAGPIVAGGLGIAALGVPTLIFTVADIVSFANDTPFNVAMSVLEVITASLTLLTGIVSVGVFAAAEAPIGAGMAAIPILLGGLNLAHAIWSFATWEPTPQARLDWMPVADLGPDHAVLGVASTF